MSLKAIEKLLTKSLFLLTEIISSSQDIPSLIFFEGTRKFRITGRAGRSSNYVGEGSDFFISDSEKALNMRLFWGTGEDGIGKCPIHQNSCYQETSSTTN